MRRSPSVDVASAQPLAGQVSKIGSRNPRARTSLHHTLLLVRIATDGLEDAAELADLLDGLARVLDRAGSPSGVSQYMHGLGSPIAITPTSHEIDVAIDRRGGTKPAARTVVDKRSRPDETDRWGLIVYALWAGILLVLLRYA